MRALIRHRRSVQLSHTFLRLPENIAFGYRSSSVARFGPAGRELLDAFRMRVQQGTAHDRMRTHEEERSPPPGSFENREPPVAVLPWLVADHPDVAACPRGGLNRQRRVALVFHSHSRRGALGHSKQCQSSLEMVRVMLFVTLQPQLRRAIPLPHHFVALAPAWTRWRA